MSLLTPAKYPVKYYKWDDDQAPQLTDADGVIKTILKACLVTGYGDKAGAGWAARFEDDSRIVLRRPLQIGNPPDIKIENGVVNGQASHRVVFQDSPNGLNDSNELAEAAIITRDRTCQKEWYLIATDFAFLFFYQMEVDGYNSKTALYMTLLYIGGISSLLPIYKEFFVINLHNANKKTGRGLAWTYPITYYSNRLLNVRSGREYSQRTFHRLSNRSESDIGYIAQPFLIEDFALFPFYCSLAAKNISRLEDFKTKEIQIAGRPMLWIVNKNAVGTDLFPLYIPLDYWEL